MTNYLNKLLAHIVDRLYRGRLRSVIRVLVPAVLRRAIHRQIKSTDNSLKTDEDRNIQTKITSASIDSYEYFQKWNDRHQGADIFVVGSSPQIDGLTDQQIAALANHIVVGGNNSFYRVPISYFMSAYMPEVLKACMHMSLNRIIKLNIYTDKRIYMYGINYLYRRPYNEITGLSRYLTDDTPYIYTLRNQALAMTHLAVVMGARRIIYIGIDQRTHAYFWQYNHNTIARIRQDLHKLQTTKYTKYYDLKPHTGYFDTSYSLLQQSIKEREAMPFYYDYTDLFKAYFHDLAKYGVQPIATLKDSVVHRAGAELLSLNKVLNI